MKLNYETALIGKKCVLVPYRKEHVPRYHEWMQDPALLEATGSEPLSIEEEYEMQESWRDDEKKCTFIVLRRYQVDHIGETDFVARNLSAMVGDVNLFLSETDDGEAQAELDIMIAERDARGLGIGKEASMIMMKYAIEKLGIVRFFSKINADNDASLSLFKKMSFIEVDFAECFQQYEYELSKSSFDEQLGEVSFEQINCKLDT